MNHETLPAQGPVDVNVSRQRCEYCDGTGDVTGLDGEYRGPCNCGAASQFEAEIAAAEEAYRKPPCLECGAMTVEEAETKCRCGGDKDSCHGTTLWPD